jgi:hypothetical protein
MDQPIACNLTEAQMRERRLEVLEPFRAQTHRSELLPNGIAYTLEISQDTLVNLAQLVDLERRCCPFLSFAIIIKAADSAIRLEITGPPEAQAMIADFFGS